MQTRKFRILSAAIRQEAWHWPRRLSPPSSGTSQPPRMWLWLPRLHRPPPVNLDNCPMLSDRRPSVGCVAQLQTELNTILGLNLSVDGTFGSTTKKAVERFQQEHNIVPADGIVGPQTKAALDNPGSSSAGTPPGQLNPGQQITSGTQIASPDGKFVLQMQSDGNLVLRAPGNIPLGDTHTAGHDGTIAVMQTDGNFVLRAPGNIPVWASGTDGHPGTVLQVQDDGHVVLYAPGHQALRVLFSTPPVPPVPAPPASRPRRRPPRPRRRPSRPRRRLAPAPPALAMHYTWGYGTGTVYFNREATRDMKTQAAAETAAAGICAFLGGETLGAACVISGAVVFQWQYVAGNAYGDGKCLKIKLPKFWASEYTNSYCK